MNIYVANTIFVVSRLFRNGDASAPSMDTIIQLGDALKIIGIEEEVDKAALFLGNSHKENELSHNLRNFIRRHD